MEMMKNIVLRFRIAPILVIMYLSIRDFFFFFSSKTSSIFRDHQPQTIYQNLIYATKKPSYLFIFFTFNILIVAVLLGISSQLLSKKSSSSSSSAIDQKGETGDHDFIPEFFYIDYENDNNFNFKNDNIAPAAAAEEEEEEVYCGLPCGYGHVDQELKGDFVPGIVHDEYCNKEEKVEGQHHDCKKEQEDDGDDDDDDLDLDLGEKDGILICDQECGYDDDEENYSELNDVELNKRIEEFIDQNNKKWRNELQNDMLLLKC